MERTVDKTPLEFAAVEPIPDDHSLSSEIARELTRAIAKGDFPAGTKLGESDLATAFKTSRTPVREALQSLHAEGLVEIMPRRGARVVQLKAVDVSNIYLCRGMLYGLAARIAAIRRTDNEADQLAETVGEMSTLARNHQWLEYLSSLEQVGDHLIAFSRVPQIAQLVRPLRGPTLALRFRAASESSRTNEVLDMYEILVGAIRAKESHSAETVMRRLVIQSGSWLLRSHFKSEVTPEILELLDGDLRRNPVTS